MKVLITIVLLQAFSQTPLVYASIDPMRLKNPRANLSLVTIRPITSKSCIFVDAFLTVHLYAKSSQHVWD